MFGKRGFEFVLVAVLKGWKPKSSIKVPLTLTKHFALRVSCKNFKGLMLFCKVSRRLPIPLTLVHSSVQQGFLIQPMGPIQ